MTITLNNNDKEDSWISSRRPRNLTPIGNQNNTDLAVIKRQSRNSTLDVCSYAGGVADHQ